jgi:hypothetical protein
MLERPNGTVPRLFPVYVLGSLILIFQLPYLVPLVPAASDSYLFGYNNRVGIALLLILATIGVVWTRGLHLGLPVARGSRQVSRRALAFSLVAVLIGCAAMFFIAGRLGGFGESSYEIDRIWLTSIGKRPYFDFEWPFGAALLYGPLAIHRLFALSIPQSYHLFWVMNCLLGVWLLYATLNAVDFPSERKTSIFVVLFLAWFPAIMNTGTHYTLTRYALPLYFIVVVQKWIRRGDARAYFFATLQVCIFTTILLLYSPEIAIAFALAAAGLLPLLAQKKNPTFFVAYLSLIALLAMLFSVASRFRVMDTVKASGGGADSFPIILSSHILLFFAALFLCLCCVYRRFATRTLSDNSLGLIAVAVPMLPAALGRCDPGHVLLNGLGIFLAALLYASGSNRFWKHTRLAFILVFIVLAQLGGLWLYVPILARCGLRSATHHGDNIILRNSLSSVGNFYIDHFAPSNVRQRWHEHLEAQLRGADAAPQDLSVIYPSWRAGYLAPFGYRPNGFGTDLNPQIDYGRFEDLENANTLAAIDQKISEIRNSPEKALILPNRFLSMCEFDVPSERSKIEFLFTFPYRKSPAHSASVRQPLCVYIQQHYTLAVAPGPNTSDYGLWINKDAPNQLSRPSNPLFVKTSGAEFAAH